MHWSLSNTALFPWVLTHREYFSMRSIDPIEYLKEEAWGMTYWSNSEVWKGKNATRIYRAAIRAVGRRALIWAPLDLSQMMKRSSLKSAVPFAHSKPCYLNDVVTLFEQTCIFSNDWLDTQSWLSWNSQFEPQKAHFPQRKERNLFNPFFANTPCEVSQPCLPCAEVKEVRSSS